MRVDAVRCGRLLVLAAACLAASSGVQAQLGGNAGNVELLLEGRIARVFQGSDNSTLYELHPRSVALAGAGTVAAGSRLPSPGEVVYVFVDRPAEGDLAVGESICASVRREAGGVWAASGPNWFKRLSSSPVAPGGETMEDHPSVIQFRGMLCKATLVGGRLGLKVEQVDEGSPADQAGFQVGDTVIAVDNKPLSSAANLDEYARALEPVDLTVVDVNTGRLANVTVPAAKPSVDVTSSESSPGQPVNATERIATSVGVTVESSQAGLRKLVKVKQVVPGSPGAQAGLEPGDLIVQVGDKQVYSIDDFAQQLPSRPGTLTFVVRDVRSGRDVPIEVNTAGFEQPGPTRSSPPTRTVPADPNAIRDRLGIAGELTFYNAEAAVKVAGVAPNSAAARAGIRPGMILTTANGKPLMHPDDLATSVANGGGQLTLQVVNPATQRESSVRIDY